MISFGVDNLLKSNPIWKKSSIAILTNLSAVSSRGENMITALLKNGFNIRKIFSPEHGFDRNGKDGASIEDTKDSISGLPIISLYGIKWHPDPEDLKDIEIVLFDLPDIGCRFYTYLWTMTCLMESLGSTDKKMIVLDRPNPLSGIINLSEGPMLNEDTCSSFIGRWSIPLRHSCTLGELAIYFNETRKLGVDLNVIKAENWNREMFFPDWGLEFTKPSPAITDFKTEILYPATGLLEATNLSEGRGTPYPFRFLGAPWLKATELRNILLEVTSGALSGEVRTFKSYDRLYKGQNCSGLLLNESNFRTFHPVYNGLLLLKTIRDLYPAIFHWHGYPTAVNPTGKRHIEKLIGQKGMEAIIKLSWPEFLTKIKHQCSLPKWEEDIKPYLLYH